MHHIPGPGLHYHDGQFGLPLHHPRFLEWVGAPESARLLSRDPNTWIRSLSRLQTIYAAQQLQHDACLMTSNLNVLDQYVLCLQGTATKLLELTVGRHDFPSAALASSAPVPWVGRAAIHMEAIVWASGTLPCVRMIRLGTLLGRALLLPALLPANPERPEATGSSFAAVVPWSYFCGFTPPDCLCSLSAIFINWTLIFIPHIIRVCLSDRWLGCSGFYFEWTGSIVYGCSYSSSLHGYILCYTVFMFIDRGRGGGGGASLLVMGWGVAFSSF